MDTKTDGRKMKTTENDTNKQIVENKNWRCAHRSAMGPLVANRSIPTGDVPIVQRLIQLGPIAQTQPARNTSLTTGATAIHRSNSAGDACITQ